MDSQETRAPASGIAIGETQTENVLPILNELMHALEKLACDGEETAIDLRRIPLTSDEEEQIEQHLGRGEVRASLDALGRSDFVETAFAGVWLVTHKDLDGEVVGKFIEVATVPSMLRAVPEDLKDSMKSMRAKLTELELNSRRTGDES